MLKGFSPVISIVTSAQTTSASKIAQPRISVA